MKCVGIYLITSLLLLFAVSNLIAEEIPGDANMDGFTNIGDAVYLINFIFREGPEPESQSAADVNNDCTVNVGDAVVIIGFIFKQEPGTLILGCRHLDISGECMEPAADRSDSSYMRFEVLGNDLHLYHFNAFYQCCLEYSVEYAFNGFEITARETDTGAPCDCFCWFDLESIYYNLFDGDYSITLIGIGGDTVGVGTFTINSEYGLIGYQHSGCLDKVGLVPSVGIEYLYSEDTLTLHHDDAYFNCGAGLMVSFEQAGDTLRFFEVNVSDLYALCMCHFEVTVSVIGILPGTYVAEIYARDISASMLLFDRRIIELSNL